MKNLGKVVWAESKTCFLVFLHVPLPELSYIATFNSERLEEVAFFCAQSKRKHVGCAANQYAIYLQFAVKIK